MRIGFVGGNGHHYLAGLLGRAECAISGIAVAGDGHDDDAARARYESLASGHDVQWFNSAQAMYDAFKPDVVNIGAVYAHNGEKIVEALGRKIPVVSDKPIAADFETLAEIESLSQLHGCPVLTELTIRCEPAIVAARAAVARGDIGDVVLATGQKSYRFGTRPAWYRNRSDYAGTVLWVASHAIDFIWYVTGLPYENVFGMGGNITKQAQGEMEEVVVCQFQLQGGAHASVHADYNRPARAATHGDDRLRVVGARGIVEVQAGRCLITTDEQGETDITITGGAIDGAAELLRAALGGASELFSTKQSLYIAKVLLHARDATDTKTLIDLSEVRP